MRVRGVGYHQVQEHCQGSDDQGGGCHRRSRGFKHISKEDFVTQKATAVEAKKKALDAEKKVTDLAKRVGKLESK